MLARTNEIVTRDSYANDLVGDRDLSERAQPLLEHTIAVPRFGEESDYQRDDSLPRRSRFGEATGLRRARSNAHAYARPVTSKCLAIKRVLTQLEQVARTPATVLLCGETGVGKEVFAQAIHDLSPRRDRPMIRVNCGAIPATLLESEFFGHERGAYTGAVTRQIGRFEAAHQSTLLLDEVGELPPTAQVKLLRVLQERVIERLGSPQPIKVDVRIIAASNIDLEEAVANGQFREDLFYRLNVFPVVIPPLRDRAEDIPALVWEFIDELAPLLNKRIESVAEESMRDLQRYGWPGNVRELRNTIEHALIVSTGTRLTVPMPTFRGRTQFVTRAIGLGASQTARARARIERAATANP